MNLIFTLEMNKEVKKIYGNHIRVRICGVLIKNDSVLAINHKGLNSENIFWSLPGGGVLKNENIEDTLKREFLEETGLTIEVLEFIAFTEIINHPLHAIELIFMVSCNDISTLKLGFDPEHSIKNQILESIKWLKINDLKNIDSKNIQKFLSEINKY